LFKEIGEIDSLPSIFIKEVNKNNDNLDFIKPVQRDSSGAMMLNVDQKLFDSPKADSKKDQ